MGEAADHYDVAVIGAGIAGASAACELARSARVVLIDRYGIQAAPAMGQMAAALVLGKGVPAAIEDEGICGATVAPVRLEGSA